VKGDVAKKKEGPEGKTIPLEKKQKSKQTEGNGAERQCPIILE